MSWISFNGKKSEELFSEEFLITKITLSAPVPKQNKVEVPYSSNFIDFSFINGVVFNNRTIVVEVNIGLYSKLELRDIYSKMSSWLYSPGWAKLMINDVNGYFLAKVVEISSLEEIKTVGNLTITFETLPWIFEHEQKQYKKILNNGDVIKCSNKIMPSCPVIISSKVCNVEFKNRTIQLKTGENRNFDITFSEGINELKLLDGGPVELEIKYKLGGL